MSKKLYGLLAVLVAGALLFAACAPAAPAAEAEEAAPAEEEAMEEEAVEEAEEEAAVDTSIVVVAREEGSGTRGAFEELVMEYKDDAGEKQLAPITEDALLQQSNGQVRTVVAETPNTIAFLSFGYLDDSINAVPIGGVEPTVENVKNGSYEVFRPLNMETNGAPGNLAQAFLDYALSAEGQQVCVDEGYMVALDGAPAFEAPEGLSGQLQLAGSTTIQPLAEVWADAFMTLYPEVTIDIQGGGSSVGVTSAGEGTVDIGMSSRAIKDSEFETFPDLQVFTVAYDGIAIVTNSNVEIPTLSVDEVRSIFSAEITDFAEVGATVN